jgi:hypothetical protein
MAAAGKEAGVTSLSEGVGIVPRDGHVPSPRSPGEGQGEGPPAPYRTKGVWLTWAGTS